MRRFNRLVTRQLGVLNDRYLGHRPLGEGRALFEIGEDGATPRDLRARPGLDSGYVSRLFAKACRLLHIRHLRTRPYTPRTNGKAERFIQTLLREWAYALPYRSADSRTADLPRWLAWYNTDRPHTGLAGRTPATMLLTAT